MPLHLSTLSAEHCDGLARSVVGVFSLSAVGQSSIGVVLPAGVLPVEINAAACVSRVRGVPDSTRARGQMIQRVVSVRELVGAISDVGLSSCQRAGEGCGESPGMVVGVGAVEAVVANML